MLSVEALFPILVAEAHNKTTARASLGILPRNGKARNVTMKEIGMGCDAIPNEGNNLGGVIEALHSA
jgi:hypothetical protein